MKSKVRTSWKWLVLWSLWAARLVRQPTPPVLVSNGWLRGTAPGPELHFEGVFEAVDENARCEQALFDGGHFTVGLKDCLHLNIYTPLNTLPDDSLPVMVFFHGGGFFTGSSSKALYGPNYLVTKGVILVTANYRLNVQGFLCLGIKEAPGNAGLKDQVAALKWIRKNIKAFGGDVDNITIFGESAGSVAVSFHVMSPMSKGLFHKAIMQSGSSFGGFSLQYDSVEVASRKAKQLGLESTDPRELYNFLYTQSDADLITTSVPREEGNILISELIFLPCVERKIDDVEPFLTETPYESFFRGNFTQVPMIIGLNSEEGLFFVNAEEDRLIPRTDIDVSLPKNLAFASISERREVAKEVHKAFFGNENVSLQTLYNLSRFIGDTFMEYPVTEETDVIIRNSDKPIYSYLFDYSGWRNVPKHMNPRKEFQNVTGATHADELFYLFSQELLPSLFENDMIDKITTMWTNFAKYGDPTPTQSELLPFKWPPMTKEEDNRKILHIHESLNIIPQPKKASSPGPEVSWKGVFDAVDENVRCIQGLYIGSHFTMGRADCLRLNVYTPIDTSSTKLLPVMVYFHGGGYFAGSSSLSLYGPNYLISKGVILVTMNYRLNVQGFLCLGIKEAPGNAGLKDQVAGLKWVQKNIKSFGGDPDNVTIFGESAGAVSVSYHVVSPMSRGLFHKAITQSGSSLTSWALQYDPIHAASQKAELLGLKSTDPRELYDFLFEQSDKDLVIKIVPRDEGNTIISQLLFIPCVEKEIDGVEPFLNETPYEILTRGNFNKVPMIIGVNSEEGLFFANIEEDHFITKIDFNMSLPKNLAFPTNEERSEVAKAMHKLYMDERDVSSQNLYNYSTYLGDIFMEYPIYEETDLIVQNSDQPVYSYLFNYDGRRNIPKYMLHKTTLQNVTGATHADDLFYIFSQQLIPTLFEDEMINKMTTMWTNFAKYG
ncbi:unnamed protein product [Chilo suppressalis]|uniref:Carboxylesterase type B domain-containing protein n=1 Tax=Chilo suppressalis TaxID=168631 RepID=A0ABN8AYL8_CHISP|nr:unnamed protein product [Chilo suppressalis]